MKYISITLIFSLLISCSSTGPITVQDDEYTNEKIATMEARYDAKEETGFLAQGYDLLVTYQRNCTKGTPAELFIKVQGFTTDPGEPKNEALMKVDDTTIHLPLSGAAVKVDYIVGFTGKQTGFSASTVYRMITAKAEISEEFEEKLLSAKSLSLRFYAGPTSLTFPVTGRNLSMLKDFLKTGSGGDAR